MKPQTIVCSLLSVALGAHALAGTVAECMTEAVGKVALDSAAPGAWRFSLSCRKESDGTETVDLAAVADEETAVPEFAVRVPPDGKRTIVVNATEEESVLVEDGNGVCRVPARPSSWVEL